MYGDQEEEPAQAEAAVRQAGNQRGVEIHWDSTCEISVGWIPGVWGYLIFHLASHPVCGSLA